MTASREVGDLRRVPAAPGRWLGLGHPVALVRDPVGFLQSLQRLGDLAVIYVGPMRFCVANSPNAVHCMLVQNGGSFSKGRLFKNARIVLGDSLFLAPPKAHRDQRRMIQPAFHRDQMARYADMFHRCMTPRIDSWERLGVVDVMEEMHSLSVEATVPTLYGAKLDSQVVARLLRCVPVIVRGLVTHTLIPHPLLRLAPAANRRYTAAAGDLHKAFAEIAESHERDSPSRAGAGDLISTLAATRGSDGGPGMTPAQIRDQAAAVLLAASETVATTLSWVWYELARHPEVRARLYAEVANVLSGRLCRWSDIGELRYVQHVLNETLRLHTPNWILSRRAEEPVNFGNVVVPAGTEMLYSPAALHRDPRLFADPAVFNPDRWSDDQVRCHRAQFIPFGIGANKCLGDSFAWSEMVIAVAAIASRLQLDHVPGTRVRSSWRFATVQPIGLRMIASPVHNGSTSVRQMCTVTYRGS